MLHWNLGCCCVYVCPWQFIQQLYWFWPNLIHITNPTKGTSFRPTISCFSRFITRIWPTWFYWPIYNSQKPLVVTLSLPKTGKPPGPCCFLDPNRLIPHSHSSRPSVTYLDLAKKNEWFLGIPLDPNYTKLSFRGFRPLFQQPSAASKGMTIFSHHEVPTLTSTKPWGLCELEDLSPRWTKASMENPPYIEWSGKIPLEKSTGITKQLIANWKLCQQWFIHFFWKKISREHLAKIAY